MPVRFYLHSKTYADGRRPIYADIRWGKVKAGQGEGEARLRVGTGQSCLPQHFTDKGRISSAGTKYLAANRELAKLEVAAEKHIERAELDGCELLPEELLGLLKPTQKSKVASTNVETPTPPVRTMAVLFADWQQARRARLSAKTLSNPTGLIQRLEEFRPGLCPEDFLADANGRCRLLDDFCTYLVEEAPLRGGRVGLYNNTISTYIKALRKLLKHAGQDVSWLVDEYAEETEGEPLTYEEVLQLYRTPVFELNEGHAGRHAVIPRVHIRDVFVFNCLTGPRYKNLASLKPSDVRLELVDGQQVPVLQYVQHKRKRNLAPVRVALSPIAYEIWQRYEGRLPVPTNQMMNNLIKQLARAAGLKREVTEVHGNGPRRVEQQLPLWKAITCHTARHSFVTLQHEGGSDLVTIQESVGHSNINMTRRYLKSRPTARHSATLAAFANLDNRAGGTPPSPGVPAGT